MVSSALANPLLTTASNRRKSYFDRSSDRSGNPLRLVRPSAVIELPPDVDVQETLHVHWQRVRKVAISQIRYKNQWWSHRRIMAEVTAKLFLVDYGWEGDIFPRSFRLASIRSISPAYLLLAWTSFCKMLNASS